MSKQPYQTIDYQPIACADYDIYEIAIMQKRLLLIQWQVDSGEMEKEVNQAAIRPLNL